MVSIPETNYVLDSEGQKVYVQVSINDWENLIKELHRLESMLNFKAKLKIAFQEVRQIKSGDKKAKSLSELLDKM